MRQPRIRMFAGPNGSGKSTILGLMAGIFYASEGTVEARTNKFGFIGAVPLIFDGSLRDNILYGNNLEIEEDQIRPFDFSFSKGIFSILSKLFSDLLSENFSLLKFSLSFNILVKWSAC